MHYQFEREGSSKATLVGNCCAKTNRRIDAITGQIRSNLQRGQYVALAQRRAHPVVEFVVLRVDVGSVCVHHDLIADADTELDPSAEGLPGNQAKQLHGRSMVGGQARHSNRAEQRATSARLSLPESHVKWPSIKLARVANQRSHRSRHA